MCQNVLSFRNYNELSVDRLNFQFVSKLLGSLKMQLLSDDKQSLNLFMNETDEGFQCQNHFQSIRQKFKTTENSRDNKIVIYNLFAVKLFDSSKNGETKRLKT